MLLIEARNRYELFISIIYKLNRTDTEVKILIVGDLLAKVEIPSQLLHPDSIVRLEYISSSLIAKLKYNFFDIKKYIDNKDIDEVVVFHDSSPLVGLLASQAKIVLFEHGLINYSTNDEILKSLPWPSWILAMFRGGLCCGRRKEITNIYLKKPSLAPKDLTSKLKKLDLDNLWLHLTEDKKILINDFFNYPTSIQRNTNKHVSIVATQHISELGAVSESKKIEIYKKLMRKDNLEYWIKPHPLDKTNYVDYFPEIKVLPAELPFELVFLNCHYIEEVVTLFSSVVLSVDERIKIKWFGTSPFPELLDFFGDVTDPRHL